MNRRPNMAHDKTPSAQLPVWERIRSFDEVDLGYTAEEAMQEAERCLNCPDRWCAQHCPAHNYIPEFIAKVREGDFQAAWEFLSLTNPLMEISGRVCPFEQQCESHCTRGIRCEPVAIGKLERFVADWHRKNTGARAVSPESNGKRVAVVGAGPAGLTCALSLANAGFAVTVYEKSDTLGGVPIWGIPGFVLPEGMMGRLFDQLRGLGTKLVLNTELGRDITVEQLRAESDAVFIATGAERPTELNVPGGSLAIQAKDYLQDKSNPTAGRVLVFGGGNTAIDAARTAIRRGAAGISSSVRRYTTDTLAAPKRKCLPRQGRSSWRRQKAFDSLSSLPLRRSRSRKVRFPSSATSWSSPRRIIRAGGRTRRPPESADALPVRRRSWRWGLKTSPWTAWKPTPVVVSRWERTSLRVSTACMPEATRSPARPRL